MMQIPLATYWQLLHTYLAPQRRAVLLMASLLLGSIVAQLMVPQVARTFINDAQMGASEALLVRTALLFIGISAVHQALRVAASYWSEHVAWRATNALRQQLTAHLLNLDYDFHQQHSPGELIERVDGDVNVLAGLFSSVVIQLMGNFLLLMGIVVALTWVDLRLGLAFLIFAIVGIALLNWVRRFGTAEWQAAREHSATFYGLLGEIIAASEDLRSSGAVRYALHRFMAQLRLWLPVARRADLWGSAIWMAAMALFAMSDVLAFGIGGWLFLDGAIVLGTVYMVVAYSAMLAAPIETIRSQLQDLQQADAAIVRIRELLAIQPRLKDGSLSLPPGALEVTFEQVTFTYHDAKEQDAKVKEDKAQEDNSIKNDGIDENETGENGAALEQISFQLGAGRILGVLGRTGSGKSTLARLLFRLVDPQAGSICVGGVDLRQVARASLRQRIGFVTQDVQLFEATLRENITCFAPNVSDEQLLSLLEMLGLGAWLARLPQGLDTPISTSTLSAGEAQLVALARVFLKDPGLIILDEASSRLDPTTETLLEGALDRLLAGRTAVIIAHRLATLDRATEILVLEQGRVVEYGPRQQLADDPTSRFARLRSAGNGELLV